MADRVRAVNLANSIVMLAQGVPFFHAGQELLRSKSLDRNSFDSGDWYNPLDYGLQDNGWARGLPPAWDNADNWPVAAPLLANPALAPGPKHMQAAADHFRELLRIRQATPLFRLRTADEVNARLRFHNTGPDQQPGLIVMSLAGDDETVVVLFNSAPSAAVFPFDGAGYALHPVQQASADPLLEQAAFDEAAGIFRVPARTAAVFVSPGID
jgi:pullulanase/glycogen debranching enzyme